MMASQRTRRLMAAAAASLIGPLPVDGSRHWSPSDVRRRRRSVRRRAAGAAWPKPGNTGRTAPVRAAGPGSVRAP
uniref:Putative secreted protein n=1 Tax=Ixodes ricinus TaxID=34613 RepID=A0A6B0U232_IXORI